MKRRRFFRGKSGAASWFSGMSCMLWRRGFRKDESGATAVEFALVAMPFFLMVIGAVELGLFFGSSSVLEGASAAASRSLRIGEVQQSENPQEVFEDKLCDNVGVMLKCDDLQYEVIHVESNTFAGAEDYEPEFDDEGNLVPPPFTTGNSNDVIIVRTFYKYKFLTPFIGRLITGADRDWAMLLSTSVIKAEPYIFGEE
jgi:Flp pilus assembly protein TadG